MFKQRLHTKSNCICIPIDVKLMSKLTFSITTNSNKIDYGGCKKRDLLMVIYQLMSYLCEICFAPSSSGRKTGVAKVNL